MDISLFYNLGTSHVHNFSDFKNLFIHVYNNVQIIVITLAICIDLKRNLIQQWPMEQKVKYLHVHAFILTYIRIVIRLICLLLSLSISQTKNKLQYYLFISYSRTWLVICFYVMIWLLMFECCSIIICTFSLFLSLKDGP